jgi:Chromo (CHRromatin Organisation MOdifier) domain
LQEFVVERIISHGETKEGEYIVRVRWHGYAADADTWEPAADIPMRFMVRYAKRKKIALSEVVPAELCWLCRPTDQDSNVESKECLAFF